MDSIVKWKRPFELLRGKWGEVPTTKMGRGRTVDLLRLSDGELLKRWTEAYRDTSLGSRFRIRGWYQTLYADSMKGKKVLDIGCGLGIDGITFAERGAKVTFVDLATSNIELVRRVCGIKRLSDVDFMVMDDVDTLRSLAKDYDYVMAIGSLHNAPFEVLKPEADELLRHLRPGGRWLQLAYPESRWIREGRLPFEQWGGKTDGENTPLVEWYDLPKLTDLLSSGRFRTVLCCEFHDSDYIWFDLLYEGPAEGTAC